MEVGDCDGLQVGMVVGFVLGKVDGDTLGSNGCMLGIFEGASNDGTMEGLCVGSAIDGF